MKLTFFQLLLFCFFSTKSLAAVNYDGCYLLFMPSATAPSFCLDGTNEEGISGAGARLVIFRTNTDLITACAVSSALGASEDSFEFILNNKKELVLSEVKLNRSRLEGIATFGKTKLQFIEMDSTTSKRLLSKFYNEPKCWNLNPGEIVKLR